MVTAELEHILRFRIEFGGRIGIRVRLVRVRIRIRHTVCL